MIYRLLALLVVVTLGLVVLFDFPPTVQETTVKETVQPTVNTLNFSQQIKPILETRCVVCHACYDAPCQLKLGSYEGIARGASADRVYDGQRLLEANLTRLFEDAHTTTEWRDKGFFPVISDSPQSPEDNIESSLIAQFLTLKQENPLPSKTLLSEEFDLNINREHQCSTGEDFVDFKQDKPLWGMPYGLPRVSADQHQTLIDWIKQGATGSDQITLDSETVQLIDQWEAFFNQNSLKAQLVSRYLYEHLFLVNLHFADNSKRQYFKLVRSSTPPGQGIKGIFTRRPFDSPGVDRVYYRIQPVKQSIVHKAHMPYRLSEERMDFWNALFFEPDYSVTSLPTYEPEQASNPFVTFAELPVQSRYKYLLDEAQNTIMQFIKGPVCRGQMALNVINDYFWVVFIEPDLELVENNNEFMQSALSKMRLPAEDESNALPTSWLTYASMEKDYLHAKSKFIKQHISQKVPVTLDLLWDGDNQNPNAGLTVFRHKTAASVVQGLIGDAPQTTWVLTYPLFERIHYLLVAGYDVFGNVGHQLNSRMYMDFLRMEGEFNFLSLLPSKVQNEVRDHWYRGSVSEVEEFVYEANKTKIKSDIEYTTDTPLAELYSKLKTHLKPTLSQTHTLEDKSLSKKAKKAFNEINAVKGQAASLMAESTIIKVIDGSAESHFYTLLRHSAHSNISHLFNEEDRRIPEEDRLTIARGFLTSHPNSFMQISESDLSEFATSIKSLASPEDYTKLMDNFGVRRTDPKFWHFADSMHEYFELAYPTDFGYLDFNRLENR